MRLDVNSLYKTKDIFDDHCNTKNVSTLANYQGLTAQTPDQDDDYQTQKLSANLQNHWVGQHPYLVTFCKMWAEHHGYGLPEINHLLELLQYAKSSLKGKLSVELSLDDVKYLWIADTLQKKFPDEVTNDLIEEVTWNLKDYSAEICWKIFQHIQGLSTITTLIALLDFFRDYQISAESLAQTLSRPTPAHIVYQQLVIPLLMKALSQPFHYQHKAAMAAYQLLNNWTLAQVLALLTLLSTDAGNEKHDFQATAVVELIAHYHLSISDTDDKQRTIIDLLIHTRYPQWIYELGRMIIFSRFSTDSEQDTNGSAANEKTAALLNRVLAVNQDNPTVITWLMSDVIKTLMVEFEQDEMTSTLMPVGTAPIHLWQREDIQLWQAKLHKQKVPVQFAEKLAVIKRAVWLAHGYVPRSVQMIAAIILYQSDTAMLAEIATGEGKSIIAAMFAVMKALEGKKVDIVTSSSVLAQRDTAEQAEFYGLFNLTVAHNIHRGPSQPAYAKDIVYGDVVNFVADILATDKDHLPLRGNRELDIVIIDEVDSAFIDQSAQMTMLARGVAGFEYLEPILVAMWKQLAQINSHFAYDRALDKTFWIEGTFEYEAGRIKLLTPESAAYEIDNRITITKKLLKEYIDKLIGTDKPILHIPHALNNFVHFQKDNWIDSAINASYYVEGKNYVISVDKHKNSVISTVDYRNTGVVHESMHWSDGVHQFLQIKHGVKIKAESLMTQFMSNMAFFKSYQHGIYGMTGTLGTQYEKEFIHEIYGAQTFAIPPYKPKRFLELPTVIADSQQDWVEEVLRIIHKETQRGRAVLLIVETINEVNWLAEKLQSINYPQDKINVYSRNDRLGEMAHNAVDSGDVIIATNLAGRGTDLKITDALNKNGGMHVCVGYLPPNLRVQWQAYGRTARQGNRGTAQLVIDKQTAIDQLHSAYPWYPTEHPSGNLLAWRDLAERERLLGDRYVRNPIIALKDELFAQFTQYLTKLRKAAKTPAEIYYDLKQIEDIWGMWLKQQPGLMEQDIASKIQATEIEKFTQKHAEVREKSRANLNLFLKQIEKEYRDQTLLKNTGYLTNKAINFSHDIRRAMIYLDRAKLLDPIYSFSASYVKAFFIIQEKPSAKQEAYNHLQEAKYKINQFIFPQLEGMLTLLNLDALNDNESELSKQTINKIALLKKCEEYIDKAMEIIAKSKPEEKIKLKSTLRIQDIMQWEEDKEDELQELNDMGIGYLFECDTYKEKKNWVGTVFSFVVGIVQIAVGIMLAPYTAGISASLIVGGISDSIAAVRSALTGLPIDLNQYISSKGIEYAVTLAMAGIASVKEAFAGAKQISTKAATAEVTKKVTTEVMIQEVKKEFVKRGIATGLAYVAEKVLDKGLDRYEADIANSVRQAIEKLFARYPKEVALALFYDEIQGAPERQNQLYNQMASLLTSHQSKYHTAAADIIKAVGANVAYEIHTGVGIAYTAANMGHSIVRIQGVTDEIMTQFGHYLQTEAQNWLTPAEAMQTRLTSFVTTAQAKNIINHLNAQAVIVDQQVVNCKGIQAKQLTGYQNKLQQIINTCTSIEKIVKLDKTARQDEMKASYINLITSSIMRRIQGEVISPLSSMIGMWGGNTLFNSLQQIQQDVTQQFSPAESAYRYLSEELYTDSPSPAPLSIDDIAASPVGSDAQTHLNFYTEEMRYHTGGLLEAELLSSALQKDMHIYTDGYYDKSFRHTIDSKELGYRLSYDTQTAQWHTYLPHMPIDTPHMLGSLYDVMALQTGLSVQHLRNIVAQHVYTYPAETYQLLRTYKIDTEVIKNPKKKVPQEGKKSVSRPSSRAPTHPTQKSATGKDHWLMNNVVADLFKDLGKDSVGLDADLERIDTYLSTHPEKYIAKPYVGAKKITAFVGEGVAKGVEFAFDSAKAFDNRFFNGKVGQSIKGPLAQSLQYLEYLAEQYTDPDFLRGVDTFLNLVAVAKVAGSVGKIGARQVSKVSASRYVIADGISYNPQIKFHLANFDGITQKKGIRGTHNLDVFNQIVAREGIKIVERIPDDVKGITLIKYQIPAYDKRGNVNGYVVRAFKKTVYDPTIWTDQEILSLGQQAANSQYKKAIKKNAPKYIAEAGGIKFQITLDRKTGTIHNFYPGSKDE